MKILEFLVILALALAAVAIICRILAIPWREVVRSIPKEVRTRKGYVSLVGFVLFLIAVCTLATEKEFVSIVLNALFREYAVEHKASASFDVMEGLWACVVFFIGNFVVIAICDKKPDGSEQREGGH